MSKFSSFSIISLPYNHPLAKDFSTYHCQKSITPDNMRDNNIFLQKYENILNICFSEKPQLFKFDSTNTDEEIDIFFDSI